MRNLKITVLLCALISVGAYAQEESVSTTSQEKSVSTTIQEKSVSATSQEKMGKFSFDVNFDPSAIFDALSDTMFSMPYIKARYQISSDMAFRLGLGLDISTVKSFYDVDGNDFGTATTSTFVFAPGIEKQIKNEKMVVYYGAELPITTSSSKTKDDIDGSSTVTKNVTGQDYFGIGLNAVIGFDFYVYKNLYLGAELTPGFAFQKTKDVENTDGEIINKGGATTSFGLSSSSGVRLGIRF